MKLAIMQLGRDEFDDKDSKIKTVLFALCYYHACMIQRKRYGSVGWTRPYAFGAGDLRDSISKILRSSEQSRIPLSKTFLEELVFVLAEIIYGGHITQTQDRLIARHFLGKIYTPELIDEGELIPFPDRQISLKVPLILSFQRALQIVEEASIQFPQAVGLTPNAQIGIRATQSSRLLSMLLELEPKNTEN